MMKNLLLVLAISALSAPSAPADELAALPPPPQKCPKKKGPKRNQCLRALAATATARPRHVLVIPKEVQQAGPWAIYAYAIFWGGGCRTELYIKGIGSSQDHWTLPQLPPEPVADGRDHTREQAVGVAMGGTDGAAFCRAQVQSLPLPPAQPNE